MKISAVKSTTFAVALLTLGQMASAQPAPPRPTAPPPAPKAAAPIDLTGYWVSIVNEDWRYRMVTPAKGDYQSVPLNPEGKQQADNWTDADDGSCKAYGVGNPMRMPMRLHITWVDDKTLKIESDWGQQTRLLNFDKADIKAGPRTLQGNSLANWEYPTVTTDFRSAPAADPTQRPPNGSLHVVTDNHTAGWLRRNGVPYSENAKVTEYYDTFPVADGSQWFVVTTLVDDPQYLRDQFMTSSHFRREPDGSKWAPHPCKG